MASGGTTPSGPLGANAGSMTYSQPPGSRGPAPASRAGTVTRRRRFRGCCPLFQSRPVGRHLNSQLRRCRRTGSGVPLGKPSITSPGTAAERSQHRSPAGTGGPGAAAEAVRGPRFRLTELPTAERRDPGRGGNRAADGRTRPGLGQDPLLPAGHGPRSTLPHWVQSLPPPGLRAGAAHPRLKVMAMHPARDCQLPVAPAKRPPP